MLSVIQDLSQSSERRIRWIKLQRRVKIICHFPARNKKSTRAYLYTRNRMPQAESNDVASSLSGICTPSIRTAETLRRLEYFVLCPENFRHSKITSCGTYYIILQGLGRMKHEQTMSAYVKQASMLSQSVVVPAIRPLQDGACSICWVLERTLLSSFCGGYLCIVNVIQGAFQKFQEWMSLIDQHGRQSPSFAQSFRSDW